MIMTQSHVQVQSSQVIVLGIKETEVLYHTYYVLRKQGVLYNTLSWDKKIECFKIGVVVLVCI